MSVPESPTPQSGGTPAPLASWGDRALGAIIDWLPTLILGAAGFGRTFGTFAGLIGAAYWAYIGHLEGVSGQSPGKAIMGLRLVSSRGEVLGSGAGIGRKFVHVLDFLVCGLGFLLPLVDAKRQTIADKVMDTYVVGGVERKPFNIDLWVPPRS